MGLGEMAGGSRRVTAALMFGRLCFWSRSLSVFWKKIADGWVAIAHRGPRDVADVRWSLAVRVVAARTRVNRRMPK
jgi:hypothetical protein